MSIVLAGVPASLSNLLQDRTLERVFHDSLFPRLLFRGEAIPELWPANIGERQVFTRVGVVPPAIKPLVPGKDPNPRSYDTEQWEAEAAQYGDTNDTHMPTSHVTLASTFLRNTQVLGMGAAQTMDRLVRNRIFSAYLAGEAVTLASAAATATTLRVSSLNGFTQKLQNGRLTTVNPANPLIVSFTGTEPANTVVGFAPDDPEEPLGAGTLTLGSALSVGVAQREGVLAATRSRRLRVGAGATVDALSSANILTLDAVIQGVTRLRSRKVPPTPDGTYHVHCQPEAEAQLFQDNHWQRLHQSLPDSMAYRDLAIGRAVGCTFYRNVEMPSLETVNATVADAGGAGFARFAPEFGGEVTNAAGLPIRRTLILGGGSIYEKYIDESKYITEAGVTGKIGQFSIVNNGVALMTNRIRYLLRAPLDRLQQIVSQSWSWSGDFPVPCDQLTSDGARFIRAVILEHA